MLTYLQNRPTFNAGLDNVIVDNVQSVVTGKV